MFYCKFNLAWLKIPHVQLLKVVPNTAISSTLGWNQRYPSSIRGTFESILWTFVIHFLLCGSLHIFLKPRKQHLL